MMKDQDVCGDALPIPVVYIKRLEDRIQELEAEVKRLKDGKSWRESSYRANMASKYGGEDW